MTFEEIFDEDGLYVADSFKYGYCFKILHGFLRGIHYSHASDLFPKEEPVQVHGLLFKKDFRKIPDAGALFESDTKQD